MSEKNLSPEKIFYLYENEKKIAYNEGVINIEHDIHTYSFWHKCWNGKGCNKDYLQN